MTDLFPASDDLDAISVLTTGDMGEVRTAPVLARAVDYTPKSFEEPCRKCGGSGRYRSYSRHGSHCFECKGAGKKTFKTSPEARAKARQGVADRKAKIAQEAANAALAKLETFRAEQPAVCAWVDAKADQGSNFAQSLQGTMHRFGSLTVGQVAAVEKCIAQDAERKVEAAKRVENAPIAEGSDKLKEAFDNAKRRAAEKGRGIRNLRITIGGMVISPASSTGSNPGALYVKDGGEYLGKIVGGKFLCVRTCGDERSAKVLKFVADPEAASKAYGKETGVCCICNSPLTNKQSIELGIGPICAEKMGW